MIKKCIICNKEFKTSDGRIKICSDKCRVRYKEYFKNKQFEKLNGAEGVDFIVCKWCGMKVKRIYGKHIQKFHSNKTSENYKKEFPGYPLMTPKDKYNTSVNAGKHMKQEKYKKMVSERIKGDKNPVHKSNMDEQSRKELSPFSKEFYKKRGLFESDRQKFIRVALKDREFDTRIEYWLKRGYSKEDAKQKIKDRQTTFSKKICIQKYGEERGLERWKKRQKEWKAKVFNEETFIGVGSSKLSMGIIEFILQKKYDNSNLHFGKNEKFIFDKKYNRVYKYDLTNNDNKKILEINGTFWHCKPELYESSYIHPVKKIAASEIWDYDKRKKEIAEFYGYEVLTIWEDDLNKFPEETIQKCIKFIYEKNS